MEISFVSVQSIITDDLGMQRDSAKFVQKIFTHDQKDNCLHIVCDMLDCGNPNPKFIKNVRTGDESLVCTLKQRQLS